MHTLYVLLRRAKTLSERCFSKLEMFTLLIAGLAHDVGHRGLTNGFLSRTDDVLAMTYNHKAVQEMVSARKGIRGLSSLGMDCCECCGGREAAFRATYVRHGVRQEPWWRVIAPIGE